MEENPFTITEKVIPKYFCDRENESSQIIRLLNNRNNIVLFSPRRIGKTGLIQYCFEDTLINKPYFTFYIDILSTTNLQEFVFLLGKRIYSKLQPFGEKAVKTLLSHLKSLSSRIGYDPLNGIPYLNLQLGDITHPEHTLDEIFSYLNNASKPCIVAIDEFQQITKYPEKGTEALLRSHMLQINNCRFIFSGSERHLLGEMFINSSKPFYQSASLIELKPIPKVIYVDFIQRMFDQGGKSIDKDFAEKIYDKYDGITFCIQKICNLIYSFTPKGEEASYKMLVRAEEEIFFSYETLYRERLSQLTLRQKELLFAIAAEKKVVQITSTEFIKKYSLFSVSTVQSSLRSLMNLEIVSKEYNHYFLEDRFFLEWLRINYTDI